MWREVARRQAFRAAFSTAAVAVRASVLGLLVLGVTVSVQARMPSIAPQSAVVSIAELPPQGRETYERIRAGGTFRHEKDGSVFGNRERLLPPQTRGYYREYTVKTPGSRDRGARRIVCGGAPKAPDRCYYTSDHYASFREIVD
ncbi:ribonuclease domain-containing protein [Xylophilus sp. GW821-FHT01B05]